MSLAGQAHPTAERLVAFARGQVAAGDLALIADHISTCDTCRQRVETAPEDDLVARLRGARHSPLPSPAGALSPPTEISPWSLLQPYLVPAQMAGEIGRLGNYRLLSVLGQGGMGIVFVAEDITLTRRIALKVMRPEVAFKPDARERFLREARAASALSHDHIVPLYQVGEDRGIPFLAMPLLEGMSLEGHLKQERDWDLPEILRLGRQIALGLAGAHARGIVHRDIKPANLWVEPDGRIKILDFGLARLLADDQSLTQTGVIVGTPNYISPEQARGETVDARADLFSLGCVLYQLCTGHPPFKRPDLYSTISALATEAPRPPRALRPDLPEGLEELVLCLLAKHPADRPASALAVVKRIEDIEQNPARSSTPVSDQRFPASAGGSTLTQQATTAELARTLPSVLAANSVVQRRSGMRWWIRAMAAGVLAAVIIPLMYLALAPKKPTGWIVKAPMQVPRFQHAGAVHDGKIYIMGGTTEQDTLRSVEVYDPATDRWQSCAPLPIQADEDPGRFSFTATVLGGEIYLPGGWRRKPPMPVNSVLIYNPLQNQWRTGKPMPLEHGGGGTVAATIDNKLCLFVGQLGLSGTVTKFLVLDGPMGDWSELPRPPIDFDARGGAVIDGKFYLVGGNRVESHDPKSWFTDRLDVFDPATGKWITKSPMPTPRANAAVVAVDGMLCVLGGGQDSTSVIDVEIYDPVHDRWFKGLPLSEPRCGAYAAVLGRTLFVVGGVGGPIVTRTYLSSVEAINVDELLPSSSSAVASGPAVERSI